MVRPLTAAMLLILILGGAQAASAEKTAGCVGRACWVADHWDDAPGPVFHASEPLTVLVGGLGLVGASLVRAALRRRRA